MRHQNERVTSGVPQGLVLGLLLMYVNYLPEEIDVSAFADGIKLRIQAGENSDKILRDLSRL